MGLQSQALLGSKTCGSIYKNHFSYNLNFQLKILAGQRIHQIVFYDTDSVHWLLFSMAWLDGPGWSSSLAKLTTTFEMIKSLFGKRDRLVLMGTRLL